MTAPPGPQRDPRAAPRRARIAAMTRVELRLLLRNGENLLVTFAIPVGALLVAAWLPGVPASSQSPSAVVGAALAAAVFAAAFVAVPITTAFARDAGVLKRLGASPLTRGDLLAAKLAALAVVVAAQAVVVSLAGAAVGWRGPQSPTAALAAVAVVALLAAGGAGVGLGLAGRLAPMRLLAVVNAVFVLALVTLGMVLTLEELPAGLLGLALVLPVTPAATLLAALLSDGTGGPVAVAAGMWLPLAGWGLVGPVIGRALFRWWDE